MPRSKLSLSVVVPTYKRPRNLEALLRSIEAQNLEPARFEVVVIDDGSGDQTPQVLQRAAVSMRNLRWRTVTNGGPARARNLGASMATNEVLVFIDDDIQADPRLLDKHLTFHEERGTDDWGLLGRVDWHPSVRVTPFMRWIDQMGLQFAYDTWLEPGEVPNPFRAFYMANISFRCERFEACGGFDETFPHAAFEDYELGWRMVERGLRIHYDPEAQAFHTRGIDLRTFRRRMRKVGESAQFLLAKHPEFPLHEVLTKGRLSRNRRFKHFAYAPIAWATRNEHRLFPVFRELIADAYCEGRARGLALIEEQQGGRSRRES